MLDGRMVETPKTALSAIGSGESAIACKTLGPLAEIGQQGVRLQIRLSVSERIDAPEVLARPDQDLHLAVLTPRQRDMLRLIAKRLANKGGVRRFGIAPATVKDRVHPLLTPFDLPLSTARIAQVHG